MEKKIIIDLEEWEKFKALEEKLTSEDKMFKIKFYEESEFHSDYVFFTICKESEAIKLLQDKLDEANDLRRFNLNKLRDITEIVYKEYAGTLIRGRRKRPTRKGYNKIREIINKRKEQ